MVRVTVGMEDIWQKEDLSIDEEEAKAELEVALEQARQSGEKMDEEKLAAQVYEAVKVQYLNAAATCYRPSALGIMT